MAAGSPGCCGNRSSSKSRAACDSAPRQLQVIREAPALVVAHGAQHDDEHRPSGKHSPTVPGGVSAYAANGPLSRSISPGRIGVLIVRAPCFP